MRLIYAVLISVCIVAPSRYGTALKYQGNPDDLQYVAQNNAGDSNQPSQKVSVAINNQAPGPKQNTNTSYDQEESHDWFAPIVLVTAAYVVVSVLMLISIARQGKQVEKQIALSDAQRVEMIQQSDHMRRQWRTMHEQDLTMREQLAEMQRQTAAIGQQTSALWEQIKMVFAKEIARLFVEVTPKRFISDSLVGPGSIVRITVTHYGMTDAFNVIAEGATALRPTRDFPHDASTQLISTPDVIRVADERLETSIRVVPSLTAEDIAAIRDESAFFHIFGVLRYRNFLNHPCDIPFWFTAKMNIVKPYPIVGPLLGHTEQDFSYWELRLHPEVERQAREHDQQHPAERLLGQ
jgi:hypothetical protein